MYSTTKKILQVNISIQSKVIAPKGGFVDSLRSVGHLKSDLNQNLISSFPCTKDHCCKSKSKYVHRFLRYVGKRQTNRQTNIIPLQKGGDKDKSKWHKRAVVLFKVFKKSHISRKYIGEEERAF